MVCLVIGVAGMALMIGFLLGWSARALLTLRQQDLATAEGTHGPVPAASGPGGGAPPRRGE